MKQIKAAAAVMAGLVAAPAGGAIAFQYVKRTVWTLKPVGGVLALAGGLFLLAKGGNALVRSVAGWRRWLAVPVGLVLAYAVAFPITIAVAATNVPRTGVGSDTPSAFGLDFTEVTLPTSDGRLRAVVAEGATNRVAGDLFWLSDAYGFRGWFQERVSWGTTTLTGLLTDARRPITLRAAVAAAAPRPVLLIAAGQVEDEAKAAEATRNGSPGTVAVWVVRGAGHTGGLRAEPAEWERRVVSFFDAALMNDANSQQQEVQ